MKNFIIITFILITTFAKAKGQERFKFLKVKIQTADSILIVGHENTNEITYVDKKTGKTIHSPKLVEKGKVNYRIIHQKRLIKDTSLRTLTKILTRPFQDTLIEDGKCFIPHHGILIFKNQKISFIDICFGCSHIATSKDIKVTDDDFDRRKWKELAAFFIQKGIIYELNNAEE